MMNHKKYQAYIFDLDNTLYNEVNYLYPAFAAIARELDNRFKKGYLDIYSFLKSTFDNQGREQLFNKLISHFNFPPEFVDLCLQKLRTVNIEVKINLIVEMQLCIEKILLSNKMVIVLTNGNIQQQKNKIEQINWGGMKDKIAFYFANEIEPKPSPAGIFKIISDYNLAIDNVLFIGDDKVDQLAAARANIDFAYTHNFKCME